MRISNLSMSLPVAALSCVAALAVSTAFAGDAPFPGEPSSGGSAYLMVGLPVFEMQLQVAQGQRRTCETRNASLGADPVLHILRINADGSATQVAKDDDSAGGVNARVSVSADAPTTYRLLMRAAGPTVSGTADLWCDGSLVAPNLPVGGAFKQMVQLREKERLQTVTLPGGLLDHVLYLMDESGSLLARVASGPNDTAVFDLTTSLSKSIVMFGSTWINAKGELRLVRNDAGLSGHDQDHDGLGKELEADIGTCENLHQTAGNWDCSRSVDARDTDSDGLSDAVELLGDVAAVPYQHLPRWGANPRHKDLFVEVDYGKDNPDDVVRYLTPESARVIASIYGDRETDHVLRLRSALSLKNPDAQAGIAVHFDNGIVPAANAPPADLALYGDWGGFTVVAAVKDGDAWKRADPVAMRASMMHPRRRPYFQYALGDPVASGQTYTFVTALNLPLFSAAASAHELGHTLGLVHSGPSGTEAKIGGEIVEANCKPNYRSVMNYAYLDTPNVSFSDGYGRAAVNNVNLVERRAIANPATTRGKQYLKDLHDVFGYPVDTTDGSVDWNRDGVISETPIRAYANENGAGCEFTRFNAVKSSGRAAGAVSLARIDNRTFIAYVDERDNKLHISHTDDPLRCLKVGDSCGALADSVPSADWNQNVRAVDIVAMDRPSGRQILIVLRSDAGLHEAFLDHDGVISGQRLFATAPIAESELSLASNGTYAWLGTRESDGNAAVRVRGAKGRWSLPAAMLNDFDLHPNTIRADSSPALYWTPLEGGRLYAALPMAPDGHIEIRYWLERERWTRPGWGRGAMQSRSIGRPSMTIERVQADALLPGRMRIAYLGSPDSDGNKIVTLLTLTANGLAGSDGLELRGAPLDNGWYYGNGVGLLYEPGVDDELRAVIATALVKNGSAQPHIVELRPLAGGIVNFIQRDWNDWEALGLGLCRIRRQGGSQMNCAPWPYQPPTETTGDAAPLPWVSPPVPQPTPPCDAACESSYQDCLADHTNPNQCREMRRVCRQSCR